MKIKSMKELTKPKMLQCYSVIYIASPSLNIPKTRFLILFQQGKHSDLDNATAVRFTVAWQLKHISFHFF